MWGRVFISLRTLVGKIFREPERNDELIALTFVGWLGRPHWDKRTRRMAKQLVRETELLSSGGRVLFVASSEDGACGSTISSRGNRGELVPLLRLAGLLSLWQHTSPHAVTPSRAGRLLPRCLAIPAAGSVAVGASWHYGKLYLCGSRRQTGRGKSVILMLNVYVSSCWVQLSLFICDLDLNNHLTVCRFPVKGALCLPL